MTTYDEQQRRYKAETRLTELQGDLLELQAQQLREAVVRPLPAAMGAAASSDAGLTYIRTKYWSDGPGSVQGYILPNDDPSNDLVVNSVTEYSTNFQVSLFSGGTWYATMQIDKVTGQTVTLPVVGSAVTLDSIATLSWSQ